LSEPVPFPAGGPAPTVSFCGYCAARAEAVEREEGSRVCPVCNMGLLLRVADDAAPEGDQAFLVVDDLLMVRGVSRQAEGLMGITETMAIDRHVSDLLEGVDAAGEADARQGFAAALAAATHGSGGTTELALRPRRTHGVRWWARVAPCAPGPAALVVLLERL
jgi:hypothetical protein